MPGLAVAGDGFLDYDDVVAVDPLRIVIDVRGRATDGLALRDVLRGWHAVDFEVANSRALVAVFGATEASGPAAEALVAALAAQPWEDGREAEQTLPSIPPWPVRALSPRAAYLARHEVVDADQAVGRISADTLAAYPPGIPNVLPGELITVEGVDFLRDRADRGCFVRGALVSDMSRIRVVA
jgi:arginine/lysine/ornithine decarboxylase